MREGWPPLLEQAFRGRKLLRLRFQHRGLRLDQQRARMLELGGGARDQRTIAWREAPAVLGDNGQFIDDIGHAAPSGAESAGGGASRMCASRSIAPWMA